MLICTLLLLNIILPSNYAFRRETLKFSDTINTNENSVRNKDDKDQRYFLPKNEKEDMDSRDVRNGSIVEKQVIIDGSRKEIGHIQRQKRGWGAVFTGFGILTTLASLGLSITQAMKKGCLYYPSICRNKDRMEDLEKRLVLMRAEYSRLYLHNRKEYLNLMTTHSTNAYIFYYINDTLQKIQTLQQTESFMSAQLELTFPKIYAKYADAQNVTSEEYLNGVLGRLQYQLSSIQDDIKDQKKAFLKSILYQSLGGAAIATLAFSIKKVYQRYTLNKKLFDIAKVYKVSLPNGIFSKLKKYPLQLSEVQTNAIVAELVVTEKSLKESRKFVSRRPSTKLIIMGVVGFAFEVLGHVLNVYNWQETADKVEKARIDYEKHFRKFVTELDNIRNDTVQLDNKWPGLISSFNSTMLVFKTLLEDASNYTQFNANVGTPQLPMNTSNPIFDINYQTLNRSNIQAAQERALGFLKEINNDVMRLVDKMYARKLLYEKVLILTEANNNIDNIFDSITGILKSSQSKTITEFGTSLTKKDVVCTISLLRSDLEDYDSFPLVIFRPNCNLSMDEYMKNEQIANTKRNRNLMNNIIFETLSTNKSSPVLEDFTESIRNAYLAVENTEIFNGSSITEKDVLCSIATQFPSKQEYDFISLVPFRPDCGAVDAKTFQNMKEKAKTVKGISTQINSILNTCKAFNFKFCPCPSMIADQFGISRDDVINLIRLHRSPHMKMYCGTTGCSCVDLK